MARKNPDRRRDLPPGYNFSVLTVPPERARTAAQKMILADVRLRGDRLWDFYEAMKGHWEKGNIGSFFGNWYLSATLESKLRKELIKAKLLPEEDSDHDYADRNMGLAAIWAYYELNRWRKLEDGLRKIAHRLHGSKSSEKRKVAAEALTVMRSRPHSGDSSAIKEWATAVDAWAHSEAPSAQLMREVRDGKKHQVRLGPDEEFCDRCGGAGYISAYEHIDGGVCYDCDGTGKQEKR